MLTQVQAFRRNRFTKVIEARSSFTMDLTSPFVVKDISGLGPVKHEVSRSQNALDRGSSEQSTRAVERNIVIKLGFKPGQSSDILRDELSSVYMPGNKVELELTTTNLGVLTITGTVESNEPAIFTKDPEVVISILCYDPYFRGVDQVVTFTPARDAFPQFSVPFEGKVPVGFTFEATMTAKTTQVALFKLPYDAQENLILNLEVLPDDIIRFNTAKGERKAELVRSAATSNALPYFQGSLVATKLTPGLNWFRFNDYGRAKDITFTYEKLIGQI